MECFGFLFWGWLIIIYIAQRPKARATCLPSFSAVSSVCFKPQDITDITSDFENWVILLLQASTFRALSTVILGELLIREERK
ncbi:hypothetical protein PanWU01x14_238180 [Parasponia andersonii]|uniref:Uncharacterized protein n=1 Tax=Parasponia andersonii TaxID=3476 RepID=A0A2P5BHL5_PARAD|nr:hypothetical protein PanWU01x14_238180 [Parasponia andersonii]